MSARAVPESLRRYIASRAGIATDPGTDPLYADAEVKNLAKLTRSAETRAGHVIERAIVETLRASPEYTVLEPANLFPESAEALRLLDVLDLKTCMSDLHLPPGTRVRGIELDLIAINHRRRTAAVYEIRRASGKIGYSASRDMLRKLVAAKMILRHFVHESLGIWPDRTEAYSVMWYQPSPGRSEPLPREMILTRDDVDAHFGLGVREVVEAATAMHSRSVQAEVARLVKDIKR